jgi:hypothetical protein
MASIITRGHDSFPPRARAAPGAWAGVLLFLVGCVVWLAATSGSAEPAARLLHPAACLGHALFAAAILGLFGEWTHWRSSREALRRFPTPEAVTWADEQWERCRLEVLAAQHADAADYRRAAEAAQAGWSADLDGRWLVYLGLAAGPFVLGMLVSLLALPGSSEAMPPAAAMFLAWGIGVVETLIVGTSVLMLRQGWRRVLREWLDKLPRIDAPALRQWEKNLAERERILGARGQVLNERKPRYPEPDGSDNGQQPERGGTPPPPPPPGPTPTVRVPPPEPDDFGP